MERSCIWKLMSDKLRLEIRGKYFAMKGINHWNNLPRGAVNSPSLEISTCIQWHSKRGSPAQPEAMGLMQKHGVRFSGLRLCIELDWSILMIPSRLNMCDSL